MKHAILLVLILVSCDSVSVPDGKILLRNDILDKEYNVVVVDQVKTNRGYIGFKAELKPGDQKIIPDKHVTSLRFTRRYQDFTRIYLVKCPEDLSSGISIRLIDVHTGRLPGGCSLTKKGVRRPGSSIEWEEK